MTNVRTKQTQLLHKNSINNKACTLTTNCFTNAEQKPVLGLSLFNFDGFSTLRDGPLENLWGGAGKVQKKYSRKGKLNEKIFMHAN